jgi:hypothetical protein
VGGLAPPGAGLVEAPSVEGVKTPDGPEFGEEMDVPWAASNWTTLDPDGTGSWGGSSGVVPEFDPDEVWIAGEIGVSLARGMG